jgi:hypothetical protein
MMIIKKASFGENPPYARNESKKCMARNHFKHPPTE